ncbi:MAG: hypothetical protein AAGJ79_07695 [Verrucomicrobiota bacterium]
MKTPFILASTFASLLFLSLLTHVSAQALPEQEQSQLEEMIKDIDVQLHGGTQKNNDRAKNTLRSALSNSKSTYEFFMTATKAVDFDEAGKRESDWREWRDENEDTYSSPEHIVAVQHQIRFLLLSIEFASAPTTEEAKAAAKKKAVADLIAYYDELGKHFSKLGTHQRDLRQRVTNTVIARSLQLDVTLPDQEGWTLSPLPVGRTYENVILPYFRAEKNHAYLQSAWDKRIDQEAKLLGTPAVATGRGLGGGRGTGGKGGGGRRGGAPVDERELEREREREAERQLAERQEAFVRSTLPQLKWEKGVDAVLFGSNRASAFALLGSHIRAHLTHENAPDWLTELKTLAKGGWDPETYYSGVDEI